jgi:hypothetical protein
MKEFIEKNDKLFSENNLYKEIKIFNMKLNSKPINKNLSEENQNLDKLINEIEEYKNKKYNITKILNKEIEILKTNLKTKQTQNVLFYAEKEKINSEINSQIKNLEKYKKE